MMNSTILRWLGQSGIEITDPTGRSCLIDPYLSDWCGYHTANPRVPPSPLDPQAIRPSLVVTSHWHEDHLDPGAIPVIGRASPQTMFLGPPANAIRCRWWGIAPERIIALDRGSSYEVDGFRVSAGFARHEVAGFLAEDAISMMIEVAGRRIFHSGDTEYDSRILRMGKRGPIDIGLFVINGTGGNMNAREAAFLAAELDVRIAIPIHYGMWRPEKYGDGATLDPNEFALRFRAATGRPAVILDHGQAFAVP